MTSDGSAEQRATATPSASSVMRDYKHDLVEGMIEVHDSVQAARPGDGVRPPRPRRLIDDPSNEDS